MLLIITSNSDKVFIGVNVDDLNLLGGMNLDSFCLKAVHISAVANSP